MPLVRGERDSVRDEVFAEGTYHAAYEPQRAIRTERWKYIRRFDDRTAPVLVNTDDSPSKELWMRAGWAERPIERELLYDLLFDPNEAHNLAGDPASQPVKEELSARLERWMEDTSDPLLDGPVPPPPGVEFNDPDQLSPGEPTHMTKPAQHPSR
jgi:arylsulfatase A-like enzyme